MGILRGTARLLLDEHRRRPFHGSVLQLGKMDVFFTAADLASWAPLHDIELDPAPTTLSHDPRLAAHGCMSDQAFFRSIGFGHVVSTDIWARDGADVLFDLNETLPAELEGRFDAVFDGGTLHHVFDLPRALRNAHRALRVGGRMIIGCAASSNHVDHGFYMFSPTLFHDWFEANNYQVEAAYYYRFDHYWVDSLLCCPPWRIHRYEPGCLDHLSYGGLGADQIGVFFVARRGPDSTADAAPQQSYFGRLHGTVEAAGNAPARRRGALYHATKRWVTRWRRWRGRRALPVVARY